MKTKSAPSITRVHSLHRIRTVVNYVTTLTDDRVPIIDDFSIADHLIKMHLSRPTTARIRDQICRRARDHLETARYLGFLYRRKVGNKFTHIPTDWARRLSKYKFQEECPHDPIEEAIFVDRICRLKLTNATYFQERSTTYAQFRTRLCLNLLLSLKLSPGLDICQLGFIMANSNTDVKHSRLRIQQLTKEVLSPRYELNYTKSLKLKDRKNIIRDTRPFLDWCIQMGLAERAKVSDKFVLTDRGNQVVNSYENSIPLWWQDLGDFPHLAAAAIILINYLKFSKHSRLVKKLLKLKGHAGLFEQEIGPMLKIPIGLNSRSLSNTQNWFDFSLSYDVPPEEWLNVKHALHELLSRLGLKKPTVNSILNLVEWYSIKNLERVFKQEANQTSEIISSKIKVKAIIPTASIHYQFRSDYEAVTYVFLQHLQRKNFAVSKYQGQLADYFADDPRWLRVARNNPDLLITDGFFSLVECKSTNEWGPRLMLNKKIMGELLTYSGYAQAVTDKVHMTTRAVFSYEGDIDHADRKFIEDFLRQNCPSVIIVLRKTLQKALIDTSSKRSLRSIISQTKGSLRNRIVD